MKTFLLTYVLILITSTTAWTQSVYTVNSDPTSGADFFSLQTAVDGVNSGDTLLVSGGSYTSTIINKKVIIIGPGYFFGANPVSGISAAVINGLKLESGAGGSTIMGVKIMKSSNNYTLWIYDLNSSTVLIQRNYIGEHSSYVINIENSSNILFLQNFIISKDQSFQSRTAIKLNASNCTFYNNIIRFEETLFLSVSSSDSFRNNVFHASVSTNSNLDINGLNFINNIFYGTYNSVLGTPSITNYNICTDNLFSSGVGNQQNVTATIFKGFPTGTVSSEDRRYELITGSPAIGAGLGGIDCGAYGGLMPYEPSGFPSGPAIIEFDVPMIGSDSIDIHIKARSGQ